MKRALLALATLSALSAPALADQALATAKNCMACHAVDKKLVAREPKPEATSGNAESVPHGDELIKAALGFHTAVAQGDAKALALLLQKTSQRRCRIVIELFFAQT